MMRATDLLSIQGSVVTMASAIHGLVHSTDLIKSWRNRASELWVNIQDLRWSDKYKISSKFRDLFSAIYGDKIFCTRRFVSSLISSIAITFFIYWGIILVQNVFFGPRMLSYGQFGNGNVITDFLTGGSESIRYFSIKDTMIVLYEALIFNFAPDLISITKTGIIIRKVDKQKDNLLKLLFLDILLTSLIIIIAHSISWITTFSRLGQVDFSFLLSNYDFINNRPSWVAFILSTYSTLLIWVVFVFFILGYGALKRKQSVQFLCKILESDFVNNIPIIQTTLIVCLISWVIWAFVFILNAILLI